MVAPLRTMERPVRASGNGPSAGAVTKSGRRYMILLGGILAAACADDSAATARDDAEPAVVADAAAPAEDARFDRDERIPSSPPDRGATPADAAPRDLRVADVPVVGDFGRIPEATPVVDAEAIPTDAAPPPVPCVPAPHVGDLPSTAQALSRDDWNDPPGNTHRFQRPGDPGWKNEFVNGPA